jgi:uncharacterized RDD family membrane protein YckC
MIFKKVEPKPYIKLRIIATLIDLFIFGIVVFGYIYVFGESNDKGELVVHGAAVLPVVIIWLFYFPGTEAINGATPGHDICKLKVVDLNGKKISFSPAFKRRLCDFIDLNLYGIPAMICISKTEKHQRLGDLWAGTLIVKKEDIIETEVTF